MFLRRPKVLVAEDEDEIRDFVKNALQIEGFDVIEAKDGKQAIELLKENDIDVVLVDLKLPDIPGDEIIEFVRSSKDRFLIPVIVMTAYSHEEEKVLEKGANYFLPKPFSVRKLLAITTTYARMKQITDELESIDNLLWMLAKIAEAKDGYTEGHLVRVREYSLLVGRELGLSDSELWHVEKGAILHDIGKIGVPDSVLLKRDNLTVKEYEVMKRHTIIGWEICSALKSLKNGAALVPLCHHERWDGRGYPQGLKGEEIPLVARIVTVCDAFDAMTTTRPYRKALPYDVAFEELERNAGKQFDPEIVKIFLKNEKKILKIAEETRKKEASQKQDDNLKLDS